MQQRPLVYVSRISNLSDARYCAGMGADLLGFAIDPSDADYVSPETYQQLFGWVSGPERVIELGGAPYDERTLREQYAPQYLHVTADRLGECPTGSWKLIVEVSTHGLSRGTDLLPQRPDIAFVLVADLERDLPHGVLPGIPLLTPITPADGSPIERLRQTGAAGIVLRGSHETAPGLKDYDHLSQVLEELNG